MFLLDIQAKIHEEIIEVVGQDRLPSLEDRKNMHYTEAFLLESFRYTSFVPMAVFHSTMKDVQYKGYNIPKDTAVISSLYHVMHDPVHFKNPDVFQKDASVTKKYCELQIIDALKLIFPKQGWLRFLRSLKIILGDSLKILCL